MGVVWKATDSELSDTVALKFLPEILATDEASIRNLRREAKALLSVIHPNIVRLRNLESASGLVFLVMEHIGGPTLSALLTRRQDEGQTGLAVNKVMWVLEQLAPALDHAHGRGILHRDLKPANRMLTLASSRPVAGPPCRPDGRKTLDCYTSARRACLLLPVPPYTGDALHSGRAREPSG